MPLKRKSVSAAAIGCALAFPALGNALARPVHRERAPAFDDVGATSSVSLGGLSVKMLGVDRPWDPRICIGCIGKPQASSKRARRDR